MIKYNLKCKNEHEFESWFSDSNEFDKLNNKNLLECIYCSSKKIKKSIMAPMISSSKDNYDQIRISNEELKNEKNNLIAFDGGYTKSRTAILDANITTLIAAIILFFMGSGPIKGFSLTLGIGIFTTLFSVYFIARLLTVIYVSKNKEKEGLI